MGENNNIHFLPFPDTFGRGKSVGSKAGLGLVNMNMMMMMMRTLMMVRTKYRETGADRHIIWDHPLSLCSILSYCVQSSLSCRDWFLALFICTIIIVSMMSMMIMNIMISMMIMIINIMIMVMIMVIIIINIILAESLFFSFYIYLVLDSQVDDTMH